MTQTYDDYGGRLKKCCEGQCKNANLYSTTTTSIIYRNRKIINVFYEYFQLLSGKLHRLLEGDCSAFPGNGSLSQYFSIGFTENRIEPDNVAIIQDEKRYTFSDLEVISDLMAEILKETVKSTKNSNPDNDSVIGICIPPSSKLIFVLFAIHKVGACYVPIDVSFPEDRVFKIVKDCKPLLVISDHHTNYISKFEIVKEQVKVLSTQELMNQVNEKLAQEDVVSEPRNSVDNELEEEDEDEGNTETQSERDSVQAPTPATPLVKEKSVLPFTPLSGHPVLAERTAVILYTSGKEVEKYW